MNISYKWLKEYVDCDLSPEDVAVALTSIGLEVGALEEVQTVKGGRRGHTSHCLLHLLRLSIVFQMRQLV